MLISKHNFSNICTRVKSPVPSVMLSLSPSPFGSRDWPGDVTQDFIGLSRANTTRSWCALWFTLRQRSFANMKVRFQPQARRAEWASTEAAWHNNKTYIFYINMQNCLHYAEAVVTSRTHAVEDPGGRIKGWENISPSCCLPPDLFTRDAHEVLLECL